MIAPKLTEKFDKELREVAQMDSEYPNAAPMLVAALARLDALENATEAAGGLCVCGHVYDSHQYPGEEVCLTPDCVCRGFQLEEQT